MAVPDLPQGVKRMLAREDVRTHHHLWHYVRSRDRWNELPQASRDQLRAAGWSPPRFEDEPGAGLDFLVMHRRMIEMVNQALSHGSDPYWRRVEGWDPIPWSPTDADWPVPTWPGAHPAAADARRPASVERMRRAVDQAFLNDDWLADRSLDAVGTVLEFSIHAWMHLRWSGPPPTDPESVDPDNDWLFLPWSSHVNKVFWKLHGWIDATIEIWEGATGRSADLSSGWDGPGVPDVGRHAMKHSADPALLRFVAPRSVHPLPMLPKDEVVEGLPGGRGGLDLDLPVMAARAVPEVRDGATKKVVVKYQVPDTTVERLLLEGVELPLENGKAEARVGPGRYRLRAQARTRPDAEYEIEITEPEEAKWKPDPKRRADEDGVVNDLHTFEVEG